MITTNIPAHQVGPITELYKKIGYEIHRIVRRQDKDYWRITFRKMHTHQIERS